MYYIVQKDEHAKICTQRPFDMETKGFGATAITVSVKCQKYKSIANTSKYGVYIQI